MDLTALIVFTTALLVAAASPGPGIIAIVARVIGPGSRGAVDRTGGTMLAGAAVAGAAK
jgi:threonine/homoserine/homoserine lactone efflux protein